MTNNRSLLAWIGTLLTLIGYSIWLTAKAVEFRTEVRTDMKWVTTSLATLVTRFSELDTIKIQVHDMDKNGTEALKEITAKLNSFNQKIEAYEQYGSPGQVKRFELMEQRLDKCERDLIIHVGVDKGKGTP